MNDLKKGTQKLKWLIKWYNLHYSTKGIYEYIVTHYYVYHQPAAFNILPNDADITSQLNNKHTPHRTTVPR